MKVKGQPQETLELMLYASNFCEEKIIPNGNHNLIAMVLETDGATGEVWYELAPIVGWLMRKHCKTVIAGKWNVDPLTPFHSHLIDEQDVHIWDSQLDIVHQFENPTTPPTSLTKASYDQALSERNKSILEKIENDKQTQQSKS